MKDIIRKYPYMISLLGTGIIVLCSFAVIKIEEKKWTEAHEAVMMMARAARAEHAAQSVGSDGEGLPEDGAEPDEGALQAASDGGKTADAAGQVQTAEAVQTAGKEAGTSGGSQTKEDPLDLHAEIADDPDRKLGEQNVAPAGTTEFIYYEPVEVSSKYYEDPGKRALTTKYRYSTVDKDYFHDAVFIGDSRMVGLYDYGGFDGADFFCDSGFCVHNWQITGEVKFQNERKDVNLMGELARKQYKKVYLMIGMNDCGYGNSDDFRQGLLEMLSQIEALQPDAIIYLMANMYITREKEEAIFNNVHINAKNVILAECADGKRTFYLEYNDLYLDENGCLKKELTFDGFHLYGNKYGPWVDFLMSHAIVKKE